MPKQILQVNFKFHVPRPEYEQAAAGLAGPFAELEGLQWKVWLMNEAEREAGGIYLFESEKALQSFLDGPLAAQVLAHPAFDEFSVKPFEVLDDPTEITRGSEVLRLGS